MPIGQKEEKLPFEAKLNVRKKLSVMSLKLLKIVNDIMVV